MGKQSSLVVRKVRSSCRLSLEGIGYLSEMQEKLSWTTVHEIMLRAGLVKLTKAKYFLELSPISGHEPLSLMF